MIKKEILFDWDDTLFSKTEYKKNLRSNLAKICCVSEGEIFQIEEEYFNSLTKSDDFTIDSFLNTFGEKFGKKIDLRDFNSDRLRIYSNALFPETISALNKLEDEYRLGIFSQGFISLQKIKIKESGVEEFFDEQLIFIGRNKLDPDFIKQIPDGVTIIEDKKEVIEQLKAIGRFELFWMNRVNNETVDGVTTVRDLEEFAQIKLASKEIETRRLLQLETQPV